VGSGMLEGDDPEMAWIQHDLYFSHGPPLLVNGRSTLSYLWLECVVRIGALAATNEWCKQNRLRLSEVRAFDHRMVQPHHEHIAAYYRWAFWRYTHIRPGESKYEERRAAMFEAWRDYLLREVPSLMENETIAIAFAKLLVYRNFDASDRHGDNLGRLLVERYRLECLAETWRGRPK
jgi:hypothetical protein